MFSKKRRHITQYNCALSEYEYDLPGLRELTEEKAYNTLRQLEGVTPETPIERMGWQHIELQCAKE
jgi:hypothetical protein